MSIKTIITDFGGVLFRIPDQHSVERFQRMLRLKNNELLTMMTASPSESEFIYNIMTGRTSEKELWASFARDLRVSPKILDFIRIRMMKPDRFNKELATFLNSLRPEINITILSNAGTEGRSMVSGIYRCERYVDDIIISAEEGLAKPDPAIYQLALTRLGFHPDEAIFMDDMQENVDAARKVGLHAILFRNTTQVITEINNLLSNNTKSNDSRSDLL